jgi:hypothetical protein
MPVRRIVRPPTGAVSGWDITAIAPIAWAGYQPEFINRRRMNSRPNIFGPPFSFIGAVAALQWDPIMPDFMFFPDWTSKGNVRVFILEPQFIAERIDCIELEDTDIFYATHADPTLTSPALINESVTPAQHTQEENC